MIPAGPQFQVNTYETGSQGRPVVASDGAGNVVVVWESDGSAGTDVADSVQGRRFDGNGEAIGPEFQVNTYTSGYQGAPAVAMDAAGGVVVVWTSVGSVGADADVESRPSGSSATIDRVYSRM